jgi:hypothetical protein
MKRSVLGRVRLLVAVLLAASSSCGGDSMTKSGPGAHILTPRALADTIEALAPSRLTVEVRDASGQPVVATKVTLDSHPDVSTPYYAPLAQFSLLGGTGVSPLAEVTDARGQLTVNARLGNRAASGWITLDAGALGRDSIHVTIRAGAPAQLTLGPRDTALAVGASYTLSATVRDRSGNSISGVPATLTVRRAQVATATSALNVRTSSTGGTFVVGAVGTAIDSVALEVVPAGTLIAFSPGSSAIATFDLDGSNYQRVLHPSFGYNNYAPRWLPQRNELVFHGRSLTGLEVGLFTLFASNKLRFLYAPTTQADGMYPLPTRDGAWIYYAQRVGWQSAEIWRMSADGSGRMRVGPVAGYYDSYSQPTPSPDGRSVVYTQNDGGLGSGVVRLMRLDITTGASSAMGAFGTHPRWSPTAPEIAYLAGNAVRIVQADGTGDRVLATYQYPFDERDGQLDWSPDGQWLVACTGYQYSGDHRLVLISRATGEVMPLPFTYADRLCEATWKR